MGYYVEVNTLVRLPGVVDPNSLSVGKKLVITRERERIIPLHIALLFIDESWNFYGYCRVNSEEIRDQKTTAEIEILSLFNESERKLYKDKFTEAGRVTGEIK